MKELKKEGEKKEVDNITKSKEVGALPDRSIR